MTSLPPPTASPSSALAAGTDTRSQRMVRRLGGFLSVAAVVLGADQWTKALVRARLDYGDTWPDGWTLIRITHVENTGAAFGIFQGAGGALTVIALGLVAAITFVLLTLPVTSRLYTVALSAILGGALGNLIDRLRLGAVTDFIDPAYYPAFNIADSAIVCGVIALLVLTWFEKSEVPPSPAEPSEATS